MQKPHWSAWQGHDIHETRRVMRPASEQGNRCAVTSLSHTPAKRKHPSPMNADRVYDQHDIAALANRGFYIFISHKPAAAPYELSSPSTPHPERGPGAAPQEDLEASLPSEVV